MGFLIHLEIEINKQPAGVQIIGSIGAVSSGLDLGKEGPLCISARAWRTC
jgi:H+/Cl- antiporter ClcA